MYKPVHRVTMFDIRVLFVIIKNKKKIKAYKSIHNYLIDNLNLRKFEFMLLSIKILKYFML